jgi:hypothetical protein
VSTVLLAGLGEVGVRAARQLLDTPGVDRLLIAGRSLGAAQDAARALHDGAEAVDLGRDLVLPDSVDVLASALPRAADAAVCRAAVARGVAVASVTPRPAGDLGERVTAPVVTGCGLAPGLADVLARHAAGALDAVDEVHVARFGVAGSACVDDARAAQRAPVVEWRDGARAADRSHGRELIWFPDPVGARDCELVAAGVDEIVAAVPGVRRASVRLGLPQTPRVKALAVASAMLGRRQDPGVGWGAVRAEVWGTRAGVRTAVVYGMIERTGVAAGTVLAVTAAWLAGALPALGEPPEPGVVGLGASMPPVPFLTELAARGVKAAAFEGVPVG